MAATKDAAPRGELDEPFRSRVAATTGADVGGAVQRVPRHQQRVQRVVEVAVPVLRPLGAPVAVGVLDVLAQPLGGVVDAVLHEQVIAGAAAGGGLELYPAALGVLVASKSYGVVRSAVVPRLLPPGFPLVKANSRVTLAGLLATGAAAPVGAALHLIGPEWPLYGACLIFVWGTVAAFTLPHKVDEAKGERRVQKFRLRNV